MAKRLYDDVVLTSERLLDLGPEVFLLYVLLAFFADDDGVVQSTRYALRAFNLSERHLEALVQAEFLIVLDPSRRVYAIRHWLVNNRADARYYNTLAPQEYRKMLRVEQDGTYSLSEGVSIDEFRTSLKKSKKKGDTTEMSVDN